MDTPDSPMKNVLILFMLAFPSFAADPAPAPNDNPLFVPSPLPFGYPRFDRIRNEHFQPALEHGMAEQIKEVEVIANNPEKPTFDNTIVALERSGRLLSNAQLTFENLDATLTNPAMQEIQRAIAPKLAAHRDAISLNPALFARIDTLHAGRATLGLDPESDRLLWRYHKDFVRAGARLGDADKAKLGALNAELAALSTTFSQNVLKERDTSAVLFDTREQLAGLSGAQITAAAEAAKAAGKEGKFLVELQNTTGQPPLAALTDRASREKLMAASLARGSRGGEFDNRAVVSAIASKRAERAALLGFPNHAALHLEEQTIGDVEDLNRLLAQLAPAAVANARREAADIQRVIDAGKGGFALAAADWDFYSERVRAERYAYDAAELRPYFEMNRVITDGLFYAATRLYGITFKRRHDLPVYEPSVQVFDIFDTDGSHLAIFLVDFYARPNKQGGAWACSYVAQSHLLGTKPVIANHLNIPKPPDGEPTLMTWDEVDVAFHEFGHALHGMFSNVRYPRFAGLEVPTDFVEYPSQVNEMWMTHPEILRNYARHHQTGEPIPAALVEKVQSADKFNQGFATTEYLAATLLDQAWHQIRANEAPDSGGVLAFEAAALRRHGVDFGPVPPRYRSTYFSHTFAGFYSAGYYSYLWSEVLDACTVDWLQAHGGLTRENGDRLRRTLLSRGGSADPLGMFRELTGGGPDIRPLLKRRGLD
jgi:peptidyl-dipeptidase Dcp